MIKPVKTRLKTAGLIAIAIGLLVWPYFEFPHSLFYMRYFDTDTLMNPGWFFRRLISMWDYNLHLGYASETNISYLSLQEALLALLPRAPIFLSHAEPIVTLAFVFGCMYAFLTFRYPDVPRAISVAAGLFYACNPYVTTLVHDGYSTLLVDYGLFPMSLLIIDYAARRRRFELIAMVLVLHTLLSMYTYPIVAINMIGIAILRFPTLRAALVASTRLRWAIMGALALNAFWAFPLVAGLKLHTFIPVLSETTGDVSIITRYASLSNSLLMRLYAGIWTAYGAIPECTICRYYTTPQYMIAALAIALGSMYAWWRTQQRLLFGTAILFLVLATGYRYQDEIVGIPYQILMSLPLFGIFRGANFFLSIASFCYAMGIVAAYQISPKTWMSVVAVWACVLGVGFPTLGGGYIEVAKDLHGSKPFPNHIVTIPSAYAELKSRIDRIPPNDVTLIVPKMPFANYSWGAYGNDFLMPYLGRPTLSQFLWPQPNLKVQGALDELTDPDLLPTTATDLMRVMRIGHIVVHDDVNEVPPVIRETYGTELFHKDAVALLAARAPVLPMFQVDDAVAYVYSAHEIQHYAAIFGRPAIVPQKARDVCPRANPAAWTDLDYATYDQPASLRFPVACAGTFDVKIVHAAAKPLFISVTRHGEKQEFRRLLQYRSAARYAIDEIRVQVDRNTNLAVGAASGDRLILLTVGEPRDGRTFGVRAISPPSFAFGLLGVTAISERTARVIAWNASNDPVWCGILRDKSGFHLLGKEVANGYASLWYVKPNSDFILLNLAQLALYLGIVVSIAGAVLLTLTLSRATRAYGVVSEPATSKRGRHNASSYVAMETPEDVR